ncbi:MAG: alpha/beta hydrolase-fold protein [Sandaracinus sp.]
MSQTRSSAPPGRASLDRATIEMATLVVHYPAARGRVVLRGNVSPTDWDRDTPPITVDGDTSVFRLPVSMGQTVEVKPFRVGENGAPGKWAMGRNVILAARDVIEMWPTFERDTGELLPWHDVSVPGAEPLSVRVMLPPGYREHTSTAHDVIYAVDGQALWSDQHDPFGVWGLDHRLDELWRLGVLDDVILVSIRTAEGRLEKLGPCPDRSHAGGCGLDFLRGITDVLVPEVDASYRTRRDPDGRGLLGASMGGLFSLFGAWRRPDVFGNAICLSSSFWWADRALVKEVQLGQAPAKRPKIYLDSGATSSPFEEDRNLRDGHHHTRAMMRALMELGWEREKDLHVLAFAGDLHDASAWGARVTIPLQLFFPSKC